MSCSDRSRRSVLAMGGGLAATMALAGCFRPMLAEGGPSDGLRGRIALPPIDGMMGYHLRRALAERLGEPKDPDYRLDVALTLDERGLAVAQDNAVTRITVLMTAEWRLFARGRTTPALANRRVAQAGYNSTGSLFAARQASEDVRRRLARDLGEGIARTILARAGMLAASSTG